MIALHRAALALFLLALQFAPAPAQQTAIRSFAPKTVPLARVPAATTAAADDPRNCLRVNSMLRLLLASVDGSRISPCCPWPFCNIATGKRKDRRPTARGRARAVVLQPPPWYFVSEMKSEELDYSLPEEMVAQHPCAQRNASRLMVLDRAARAIRIDTFQNMGAYLRRGDCLVLNDTRVIRARLKGRKTTGGQVEIFLLRELEPGVWAALVRPSARVRPGTRVRVGDALDATVRLVGGDGLQCAHSRCRPHSLLPSGSRR